jgi:RNA polymerase sigma factor (TIGR02999 family)
MPDVTQILSAIERGEPAATEKLLPLVYDELRRLAARELAAERGGQTLQPTALVHEAYLRLVDQASPPAWNHRGHFFAAAAEAMRRILVENARRKRSTKHGGELRRSNLDLDRLSAGERSDDLVALDEALAKLESTDPRKAELVKLRYFAGLTMSQAAGALNVSVTTAERDWAYARVWLLRELTGGSAPAAAPGNPAVS